MKKQICLYILVFVMLTAVSYSESANPLPPWDLILDGTWEFTTPGMLKKNDVFSNKNKWGSIHVPALWNEAVGVPESWILDSESIKTTHAWYKTGFIVPEDATKSRAILQFEGAKWGCTAWINRKELGKHIGGYAPFSFDLTGHLNPGLNELVLKIDGWGSVPFTEDGFPRITTGTVASWCNQMGGIVGEVNIHFSGHVSLPTVQIIPQPYQKNIKVNYSLVNYLKDKEVVSARFMIQDSSGHLVAPGINIRKELEPEKGIMYTEVLSFHEFSLWEPG